jgi:cytochrome c
MSTTGIRGFGKWGDPTGEQAMTWIGAALLTLPITASIVLSQVRDTDAVTRGLTFVSENCARCHAVGRDGSSPLAAAPPFRTLHERYPVEALEEALAEGIYVGHPAMPVFVLEPEQIADVIAYLKSLESPAGQ